MSIDQDLLLLLHHVRRRLGHDLSLEALATRAGWSPFHLHRAFRRVTGETPKQYTLRLRLEAAAARLVSSGDGVLAAATAAGFASHEVFTRAFRRHFGRTPSAYRDVVRARATPPARARHAEVTATSGPCIGLFHMPVTPLPRRSTMTIPTPAVARRELTPQPALVIRRRVERGEIAATIGTCLGAVFAYCQKAGYPVAGPPFSRYPSMGPGLVTIECGMPLAAAAPGEGDIEAILLPGGSAAVATHAGPYDRLGDTYAVMERWIEEQKVRAGGPPWEVYVTDPADYPNPEDWKTEVCWPLAD